MGEGRLPDTTEQLQETPPSVSTLAEAVGAKQRTLPFLSDQGQTFPLSATPTPLPPSFLQLLEPEVPLPEAEGGDLEPSLAGDG